MNYTEAIEYMSSLLGFGIKLGLERFEELLRRLDNPHHKFKAIHLAGTNGKGSTTAFTASTLRSAGYQVGGYYSPYVFDVRERVTINSEPISKDDFARWVALIRPHIEAIAQTELGNTTEFELKTALGFCYFAEREVDFAAIEVGMGGRLDATNALQPLVSVITNIGMDHTEHLGDTYAKIAAEKAGIIKPNTPVVTAVDNEEALKVIQQIAQERNAPLLYVKPGEGAPPENEVWYSRRHTSDDVNLYFPNESMIYARHYGLRGSYQAPNIACAVAAVKQVEKQLNLRLPNGAIEQGIATAWLPGRFQLISEAPTVILDGAHNAEGAQALAQTFQAEFPQKVETTFIIGMLKNHDPDGLIDALAPLASNIVVTQPSNPRAMSVEQLSKVFCEKGYLVTPKPDLQSAVEYARTLPEGKENVLLITGSFYLIGEVKKEWFEGWR